MKKREGSQRVALSLLLACLVFVIDCASICVAVGVIYVLMRFHIIQSVTGNLQPTDIFLFLVLISSLTGFLLSMLLGRKIMNPINRFINQMNRLAQGDFKARIHFGKPIGAHSVFRQLEESFNTAAQELEHTEMLRADFVNNYSHEFKTPIVSIAGFAKLLRRGNLTKEQQAEYLAIIEEESLRLSNMATNVLNLTRVEDLTILSDVTEYNLSEQIRSAILLLEDKWAGKNLDFNLQLGEYDIRASEELLKQVWINLIDNAVKFSDAGGCVDITVASREDRLAVFVTNSGRDIPEESLHRIFQKFYQADESHSSEGNGIGLAIVKKVVQLHKGTVDVQSGGGKTTFTVELPKG